MKTKKSTGINYKAAQPKVEEETKEPSTVLNRLNDISKKRMLQLGVIMLVSVLFFGAIIKKS